MKNQTFLDPIDDRIASQLMALSTKQSMKTVNNFSYSFEKLEIWRLSVDLIVSVYSATSDFSKTERSGLTAQIRKAATSVSANIAEGSCRLSKKEKARFIQIAYGSLIEVLNFLMVAEKLKFLPSERLKELRGLIEELSNKINAYHRSLR